MRDTSLRVDVGWNRKYIHFSVDLRHYMTRGCPPGLHYCQSIMPTPAYGMVTNDDAIPWPLVPCRATLVNALNTGTQICAEELVLGGEYFRSDRGLCEECNGESAAMRFTQRHRHSVQPESVQMYQENVPIALELELLDAIDLHAAVGATEHA